MIVEVIGLLSIFFSIFFIIIGNIKEDTNYSLLYVAYFLAILGILLMSLGGIIK